MNRTNRRRGLSALFVSTLCFCSITEAAVPFDVGQALKDDMAQSVSVNPYTDIRQGIWTFGKTTRVSGGDVTAFDDTTQYWAQDLKGFSGSGTLPTLHVNMASSARSGGPLTSANYGVFPGEIVLHPDHGDATSPYALIRLAVPKTGVYNILATFRDVSIGVDNIPFMGVDVHVVVNGKDVSRAVVSADTFAPEGAVPSFTADVRSLFLAAGDTIDFVVGSNGTGVSSYASDGTCLMASITEQSSREVISFDINGYTPLQDAVPSAGNSYFGAARIGWSGDYWNREMIANATVSSIIVSNLKLTDGVTNTTVGFTWSTMGGTGLLSADRTAEGPLNALFDDYIYVLGDATNCFAITGLIPNGEYDLYFYCHAGVFNNPGRIVINGKSYDSSRTWFTTDGDGDYAACIDIMADSRGSITGGFSRADPFNPAAVLNGFQITGTFPRGDLVNIDLNGYTPGPDPVPASGDTFGGAARLGLSEDYWNRETVANATVSSITMPRLKLSDGLTKSMMSFNLSMLGGGLLNADRNAEGSLNPLLDDYVYVIGNMTNRFTLAGLMPSTDYTLYFYCRAGNAYTPGRFVINGVVYDSVKEWFLIGGGGDYAVCANITADSSGTISGDFCQVDSSLPAVLCGMQISGLIPRVPQGTFVTIK